MNPLIIQLLSFAFEMINAARAAGATDADIERVRAEVQAKVDAALSAGDAALARGEAAKTS